MSIEKHFNSSEIVQLIKKEPNLLDNEHPLPSFAQYFEIDVPTVMQLPVVSITNPSNKEEWSTRIDQLKTIFKPLGLETKTLNQLVRYYQNDGVNGIGDLYLVPFDELYHAFIAHYKLATGEFNDLTEKMYNYYIKLTNEIEA